MRLSILVIIVLQPVKYLLVCDKVSSIIRVACTVAKKMLFIEKYEKNLA